MFAGAAVALVAFIGAELRGKAPMLDLGLFRRGTFTWVMIGALLLSGAAFSYFAYESLWLQAVLGMGPVTAGLCFVPMSGAAVPEPAVNWTSSMRAVGTLRPCASTNRSVTGRRTSIAAISRRCRTTTDGSLLTRSADTW